MQKAIEKLQCAKNLWNIYSKLIATTPAECNFKVALMHECDKKIVDAQRELDQLGNSRTR